MSETRERDVPPARKYPDIERRAAANDALDVEPLMTVCPNCGTRFRVTEMQLQAARGRVRCGACGSVFDGVDQLVLDGPREFSSSHDAAQALDELMAELMADRRVMPPPQAAETAIEPSGIAARADGADAGALHEHADAAEPAEAAEPASEADTQHVPGADGVPGAEASSAETDPVCGMHHAAAMSPPIAVPDGPGSAAGDLDAAGTGAAAGQSLVPAGDPVTFARPRSRGVLWLALLLPVVLAASAAAVLWLHFDTLVRDPAWRSTYERLCPFVGCEIPVRRALALVRPRNLTVESAGRGSGQLVVRVLLTNDAGFAQPFPILQLSFSDLAGLPLAGHRFQPREYLAGDARGLELMPVRTPVQLELRIPDPGANAVNYQLDLL
jgi:predicted Zn finger-like uncharacterized protein